LYIYTPANMEEKEVKKTEKNIYVCIETGRYTELEEEDYRSNSTHGRAQLPESSPSRERGLEREREIEREREREREIQYPCIYT
jgi:hypothetical protein